MPTVTLRELGHTSPDETELLWQYVSRADLDIPFTVRDALPAKLKTAGHEGHTLIDSFRHASFYQKRLVNRYRQKLREGKLTGVENILIFCDELLLDGHHRAMAAILENAPMRYIDVAEPVVETSGNTVHIVSQLLEEVSPDRIQFIADQFGMNPDEVQKLSAYDPSGGKYLTWIVNQVRDEKLRFPEDGEKVMQRLEQFQKLSRKPNFAGERDLNQYPSYGELAQVIDQNAGVKTKGEVQRTREQEGVRLLKAEGDQQLFEVTSQEAAAKLFRHTEWCVKDPKWFSQYTPARFFYLEKGGKPLALLHPESGQLKDVKDEDVTFRVPLLEPYILQSAGGAYRYALYAIKGRWPEAEAMIMKDAEWAYWYALYVIKGRWPEAEPVIMKDAGWACWYAHDVIKGRWPEAEAVIMKDAGRAYWYARDVIKGRWPEAEAMIMKDAQWAYFYARYVIKGRWPEAEAVIMQSAEWAYEYALLVIKGRWPEAEPVIMQDAEWARAYKDQVLRTARHG